MIIEFNLIVRTFFQLPVATLKINHFKETIVGNSIIVESIQQIHNNSSVDCNREKSFQPNH